MSQDTEHTYNNSSHSKSDKIDDQRLIDESANHPSSTKNKDISDADTPDDTNAKENLEYEDFSEDISKEDQETIKKVANDDNLSQAKSYASILVEQVMDARETFERSLGETIPDSV